LYLQCNLSFYIYLKLEIERDIILLKLFELASFSTMSVGWYGSLVLFL